MADQLHSPADVEQAIIDELSSTYSISTSIPDNPPAVFFRVVAVGGVQRDLVTDSWLAVLEAFAPLESTARNTMADALARLELAARKGHIGSEVCYGFGTMGLPQNLPLPSVPTHKRYITTITPALRRRVITL